MSEFDIRRKAANEMAKAGVITKRQLAQRLRQINRAEGKLLYTRVQSALKELNEFQDKIERTAVRADLLRKLSLSLKRYEHAHE